MSYVDPFGGSPVNPVDIGYKAFSFTVNTVLEWPSLAGSTNIVARIMDLTPVVSGLFLTMPAANQAGVGIDTMLRNVGAFSVTITDAGNNVITTLDAGAAKYIYLRDNSTANGGWTAISFGLGSSSVDASALVGYGLKAITGTLNQYYPAASISGNYTILSSDRAMLYVATSVLTLTLPTAAGMGDGFFFMLRNASGGVVTIARSSSDVIDGATSLSIADGESMVICSTGSTWYTVGRGRASTFAYTRLVKSVAGNADVTLSSAEGAYQLIQLTGALTGNINVVFPTSVGIWYIDNQTSGAYTVNCKTLAGTGYITTQGQQVIIFGDGTNIGAAQTVFSTSGSFGNGSAGSPSIAFASDTDTGLYRTGANQLGIAIGGVNVGNFTSTGLTLVSDPTNALDASTKQYAEKVAATLTQNSQSGNYTLVLGDAGKHILHPSADTTARNFIIPANASVAFPIGTCVTFVNQNAGGVITIQITTDVLRLAGAGTTGNRSLAANGVATAIKLTATEWIISGTGLT